MLLCDSPSPRGQLYKDHLLPLGPREARGQITSQRKRRRHKEKNSPSAKRLLEHTFPGSHIVQNWEKVRSTARLLLAQPQRGSSRENKATKSSLSHIGTAAFTEVSQGFLFQGEEGDGKGRTQRLCCLQMLFPYGLGILKCDCLVRAGYFQPLPSLCSC